MKTYPNEALGINDIIKYSYKLFDTFEKLEFRTTFAFDNILAFYSDSFQGFEMVEKTK